MTENWFNNYRDDNPWPKKVLVGSTKILGDSAAVILHVCNWIRHEEYDTQTYVSDIGIIKTKEEIMMSQKVQKLLFPGKNPIMDPEGSYLLARWGDTQVGVRISKSNISINQDMKKINPSLLRL